MEDKDAKETENKHNFSRFLQNLDRKVLEQKLNQQKIMRTKKQTREKRINQIKIIPCSLWSAQAQIVESSKNLQIRIKQCYFGGVNNKDSERVDEELQNMKRIHCNSLANMKNGAKVRIRCVRKNWKLQLRKDQLNKASFKAEKPVSKQAALSEVNFSQNPIGAPKFIEQNRTRTATEMRHRSFMRNKMMMKHSYAEQ